MMAQQQVSCARITPTTAFSTRSHLFFLRSSPVPPHTDPLRHHHHVRNRLARSLEDSDALCTSCLKALISCFPAPNLNPARPLCTPTALHPERIIPGINTRVGSSLVVLFHHHTLHHRPSSTSLEPSRCCLRQGGRAAASAGPPSTTRMPHPSLTPWMSPSRCSLPSPIVTTHLQQRPLQPSRSHHRSARLVETRRPPLPPEPLQAFCHRTPQQAAFDRADPATWIHQATLFLFRFPSALITGQFERTGWSSDATQFR